MERKREKKTIERHNGLHWYFYPLDTQNKMYYNSQDYNMCQDKSERKKNI